MSKSSALKRPNTTLDDKYTLDKGYVYLSGTQALVRLPLLQRQLDQQNKLNTAGFVSGYRGSPLARLDQQLWDASEHLEKHHITFTPGINEDLGATAVWGSQQVNLFPGSRYDGVFGMWYGKGPGVDRSIDAFKHANAAGTDANGGVLALTGDDHACVSSTLGHQSEHALASAFIPTLYPSNIQEYLDFGLYGWAMSRYTGGWVGFKCVTELVESSASVSVDLDRINIQTPKDYQPPKDGLSIRKPDQPLKQEQRLEEKLKAAQAFVRANNLDKTVLKPKQPKLGIISAGKSWLDTQQALSDLGLDEDACAQLGIGLYKVAMVWPLEPENLKKFASGFDELLIIEEKRDLLESQVRSVLYGSKNPPQVIGKHDAEGNRLLRQESDLSPGMVALAIAARIEVVCGKDKTLTAAVNLIKAKEQKASEHHDTLLRLPYYCAGCPHNISTKVPDGSRGIGGIGCHYMVQWMDRNTDTITHMGGEGVTWLGTSPFTNESHVFANLGDGTYYHSGLLAIRAAVAGKANITYKILYNDAVAMTGGQPVEGGLTVAQITHQLKGEGVARIVVVSDDIEKYNRADFADGTEVFHRSHLERLQRELREVAGTTVIVYDQTCAAEKRRRRKRRQLVDPAKWAFINERICEGCGDCSVKSNCVAVEPLETSFGRKRQINQSVCNKDYSCVDGFCPSFITVHGGQLRKNKNTATPDEKLFTSLPAPKLPKHDKPYDIMITGIGGTGVITIGNILGMAAHLEGKGVTVLDQTGLAQKNGGVSTHVKIAKEPQDIHAIRIASGGAQALIGCDTVVSATANTLSRLRAGTVTVLNTHLTPTSDFILNPSAKFKEQELLDVIEGTVGKAHTHAIEASRLATALLGDAIGSNVFMLGYSYQLGALPLSQEAIFKAIELNGVAIDFNKRAFNWGRLAAHDLQAVLNVAQDALSTQSPKAPEDIHGLIDFYADELAAYQNQDYAQKYKDFVATAEQAEATIGDGSLTKAVAENAYKVMAYKDEYEVARLLTSKGFRQSIAQQFEGRYKVKFHLAPPLLARKNPLTGEPKKMTFGTWVLPLFKLLAPLRKLRGTKLDIFGYTHERKMERRIRNNYMQTVTDLLPQLNQQNYAIAVALAKIPVEIRGFGHIKAASLEAADAKQAVLHDAFKHPEKANQIELDAPAKSFLKSDKKTKIVLKAS